MQTAMQNTKMQMDLHRPNSLLYYKLSLHTLALVLKAGITISRPDPKADAKLQVSKSGVYPGGTIKVIVVSLSSN